MTHASAVSRPVLAVILALLATFSAGPAAAQGPPAAAPAPAAAPPPAPSTQSDRPAPLAGPVSAVLQGNGQGGVYHYWRLDYPGVNDPITLVLTFSPSDAAVASGVQLAASQDGRQIMAISGQGNYCNGTISGSVAWYGNAPIIVTVVNFIAVPVSYTLTPIGLTLPPPPGAAPPPGGPYDKTRPDNPPPLLKGQANTVSGTMPGRAGGGFNYYRITDQPGDGSTITLSLGYYPYDAITANSVGLNLYAPSGALLGTVSGTTQNPVFNLNNCNRWATLVYTSRSTDPILVQVYNYTPNIAVGYTLTRS